MDLVYKYTFCRFVNRKYNMIRTLTYVQFSDQLYDYVLFCNA